MGQPCRTCLHPRRAEIDQRIVAGEPKTRIAVDAGLDHESIERHADHHIPATLAKAVEVQEVGRAGRLLAQLDDRLIQDLVDMRQLVKGMLGWSMERNDVRTALAAARELRETIRMMLELRGHLSQNVQINYVAVMASPEWQGFMDQMAAALAPFPEAAAAVAAVLPDVAA